MFNHKKSCSRGTQRMVVEPREWWLKGGSPGIPGDWAEELEVVLEGGFVTAHHRPVTVT